MVSSTLGPVVGSVQSYDSEEGLGVIESEHVPGPLWVHFSMIESAGFRELKVGQAVRFTYEDLIEPIQDGYRYRAVKVWPDALP